MKKFFIALTLLLLSTNASLAEWQLFPAFYDVTGVASNDTLNVRSGIGTKHPITHKLKHNQRYVEIVRLSDNGLKWSCKIGQSVKVYSNTMKEYQNDEETEVFRSV